MASVEWGGDALENLEALDLLVRERVLRKVTWFEANFDTIVPEPLHRELVGLYKLRIGDYRIVYSVRRNTITIEAVGHRRDIYR